MDGTSSFNCLANSMSPRYMRSSLVMWESRYSQQVVNGSREWSQNSLQYSSQFMIVIFLYFKTSKIFLTQIVKFLICVSGCENVEIGWILGYQLYKMFNRLSINEELHHLRAKNDENTIVIHFNKVIEKQREVIISLQSEILLLKSYISLQSQQGNVVINSKQSAGDLLKVKEQVDSYCQGCLGKEKCIKKYELQNQELIDLLELKPTKTNDHSSIVTAIKDLKEELIKKRQPIFVERVKQIKVPITIQKIIERPVEKIVEKVVYIERPSVVFKEKIVQKFIQRKDEPQMNSSFSEKTLKIQRQDKERDYDDSKYNGKSYQSEFRKQPEYGSNLIKKRDYQGKYYKRDY